MEWGRALMEDLERASALLSLLQLRGAVRATVAMRVATEAALRRCTWIPDQSEAERKLPEKNILSQLAMTYADIKSMTNTNGVMLISPTARDWSM
jgi:hypothetical protein